MPDQIFEFRGVDNFYFAKILQDDENGYICDVPVHIPVQEVGKSVDTSNEAHYYDNKAMIVVNSESADTITLTIAPPSLDKLAKMIGKSFDEDTGMMVDSERLNRYFAIMYRTKGTDGKYRYVSRLKGMFNIPEETSTTEDDGTDTSNTEIEYTGITTEYQFIKGKKDGDTWVSAGAKGIVVDTRFGQADVSTFFTAVQTPDTVSSSPSLGALNVKVVAGSTGKYQVDTVSPVTADGNKLMYKAGATAETVTYDQNLGSWTPLQLDTDISGTAGNILTVAEVTKTGAKARKVGIAEIVVGE